MGRIKSFEKRKAREAEKATLGVSMPVICAGADCEGRSYLGWIQPAPFAAALFRDNGWMALTDPGDGIVRFYCPDCYEKVLMADEVVDLPT